MRNVFLLSGVAIIAVSLILSLIPIGVAERGTDTTQFENSDATATYTAAIVLLDGTTEVFQTPFSLTYNGVAVTSLRIDVTYSVTGQNMDWTTLAISGNVHATYSNVYDRTPILFDTAISITEAPVSGSWSKTYSLDELCTDVTVSATSPSNSWFFMFDITLSASANDDRGNAISASLANPLSASIYIVEQLGTLYITGSLDKSAASMIDLNAVGGGVSPVNPALLGVALGLILVFVPILLSERRH